MNKDIYIYIGIAVATVVLAVIIWLKTRKPKTTADLFKKAKLNQTSPNGLQIYGETVSAATLQAFDVGARRAFDVARQCKNYDKKLNHSDWKIFVLPSHLSPVNRTPSYYHPFPNNKERSKNFIVGGEYILIDDSTSIAVAHPQGKTDFAADIVYNELEHGLAAWNNFEEYVRAAVPGHEHPLWADCRGNAFRSERAGETPACGTGE